MMSGQVLLKKQKIQQNYLIESRNMYRHSDYLHLQIEKYANQVEVDRTIEAENSLRGILNELGKLL